MLRAGEPRLLLRVRLEARRAEIEQTILTRVYSLAGSAEVRDPEYVQGLRAAVVAALDYGLAGIEEQGERAVPVQLLIQARLAARNRISLDTVLRRYFAGYTLLGDFLMGEAEDQGLVGAGLKQLLRTQAVRFDRLIAAVSEEHAREATNRFDSSDRRRAEQVERLLAGELLHPGADLAYGFDCHHLGVIATGPRVLEASRDLATALDRRLLLVDRGEEVVWAWLGGREQLERERIERCVARNWPEQHTLVMGEPGAGLSGWRLTHRQAAAALPIALLTQDAVTSYDQVALLASAIQDDLLFTSLRELYLKPLEGERDRGAGAKETLRAYFKADRNISSAAAALGMPRNTFANRLQAIEEKLDRSLSASGPGLEVVIGLDELTEQAGGFIAEHFAHLRHI